ncbi:MAG: PAS domain S-box protein [Chloroflexi bacterium]|nr:PAS domain S-box protein [Chloroflexota bacterium]
MSPSRPRRARASPSSPKADTPRPESAAEIDLRALTSAAGDVILVADYDGRFVRVSATDTTLLYRPAAELIGHTVHEVFPQPQADAFLGIIRRALEIRQPVNYEYDLQVGGDEHWFAATAIPMLEDQVLWIARDITERRQMENISEDQRAILELIASGSPFQQILETLARAVETRLPGAMCSIAILDAESQRLRLALALSLPEEFVGGLDGLPIGPQAGSCGTAAFRGETVIVSDIKHDELWADYREAALAHGLRACWSKPAFSSAGKVLGTIAFYFREPRSPGPYELRLIDTTAHLASIIIQRHEAEEAERERVSALQHTYLYLRFPIRWPPPFRRGHVIRWPLAGADRLSAPQRSHLHCGPRGQNHRCARHASASALRRRPSRVERGDYRPAIKDRAEGGGCDERGLSGPAHRPRIRTANVDSVSRSGGDCH